MPASGSAVGVEAVPSICPLSLCLSWRSDPGRREQAGNRHARDQSRSHDVEIRRLTEKALSRHTTYCSTTAFFAASALILSCNTASSATPFVSLPPAWNRQEKSSLYPAAIVGFYIEAFSTLYFRLDQNQAVAMVPRPNEIAFAVLALTSGRIKELIYQVRSRLDNAN